MRRTLAGFLHMDGRKRIEAFDQFCGAQDGIVGAESGEGKKEFKSTSFVPTSARHSLDLPLLRESRHSLETVANGLASRSTSRSRGKGSASGQASGVPSPDMTPDPSSPWASLYDSLPCTPRTPGFDHVPYPPPIEIVLLNPTDEPIRRSVRSVFVVRTGADEVVQTSYIKYALRCAGILYHVRDDVGSSFVESPNPFESDDPNFTCYLQCVIKLPPSSPPSKASSALIAALRPRLTRAQTTGDPVGRSSSTPPTGKGANKASEEIKALVFFLSIRRAAKVDSGRSKRNASEGEGTHKGRKRRQGDRIVVTLSDERALEAVRDALRIGTDSPIVKPVPTEVRRGRTGREERREGKSEGLGLELGPTAGEKKGFFEFAFGRPAWLGARSQSVVVGAGGRTREEVPLAVGGFV